MNERAGFLDGVLDRTLGNLRGAWRDIAESAREAISGWAPRPDLSARDDTDRLRDQMRACLDGKGGEVSARARAAELGRTYLALNATGRQRFLRLLATEFDTNREAVDAACERLATAGDDEARHRAERELRVALEAPRTRLLTQFNALPEGVKFLVDMRAELVELAKTDRSFASLEQDLRNLLASWFDIGFLELQRITWEAPAALLEKLIVYEAVHAIRSWTDLKNRLEADRRCFAFFHPRMPHEPLIFVEVALVDGISDNIHSLLDESAPVADPHDTNTAIFYSISNCQQGLAGISFGNFLIKRVVDQLAAELPRLKTFATLSPIPGFGAWLEKRMTEADPETLVLPAEKKALMGYGEPLPALLARPRWFEDEALARALRDPLLRLAANYLQSKSARGRAVDPVAHFHLTNGARIERLDWLADLSPKGLKQSAGIMVNYLYRLADIETNHEAYTGEQRIAASSGIRALART